MTHSTFLRAVAAAALALFACAPAPAQDEPGAAAEMERTGDEPDTAAEVERAREMIFDGDPAAALELLRSLAEADPDDTDAHFFRGMAANALADLPDDAPGAPESEADRRALRDEAVASYRHILETRPGLAGARLELARVLFERGRCLEPPDDLLDHLLGDDCDAAAFHFRRALAGDLPDRITAAVLQFLAAVQARKRVSGSFSVAVAPDSNVNAATSARRFRTRLRNVFTDEPLEFELNEEARATSGVGAIVSASGEYLHPAALRLFDDSATRLRLGGAAYRREYRGHRFDDMTVTLHAGPQLLFPVARGSLLARAERRWFGAEPVSDGFGLRLEGGFRIGERLWIGGGAEGLRYRYRKSSALDGPRLDLDLDAIFSLTPAVTLGARAGWQRSWTKSDALDSSTRRVGGFAVADLPPLLGVSGFEVGAFQDFLFTRYDDTGYALISADPRSDRLSVSRLSVSNDNIELFRFAPSVSLVHERRRSNIANVFDYRRTRGELTMRRVF